jgi:hypothetical protein
MAAGQVGGSARGDVGSVFSYVRYAAILNEGMALPARA